jgi:hypothetical protein
MMGRIRNGRGDSILRNVTTEKLQTIKTVKRKY